MPKVIIPSIDEFSDEDKKHAVKNEDGTFTIDVRPTAVVTDFRNRNLSQTQLLENTLPKVQAVGQALGIEIKELSELDADQILPKLEEFKTLQQQVADGKLVADTSLEQAITQRTAELKTDMEKRISDQQKIITDQKGEIAKRGAEMDDYVLTNEITTAVLNPASGIRPEALPDVLSRAKAQAKIGGDKKLVFLDGDKKIRYGADAESPLTKEEWIRETLEKAPHFGKTSSGGDADNQSRTGVEALAASGDTEGYVAARMKQMAPAN